ncbi:MAG: zinc-ribbon domain-containing protein [Candidatus Lokiarchaeota archaeon]|nr:zinc-ribbon domain-containing protein [Candidatus Lokiarchaeota archaeon]MBD3200968.1 zinc-ribbon domain-containing protein [Candidatus Lokiarchaeota archaeon]
MFCPMCGSEIKSENVKFCPNCGNELHIPSGVSGSASEKKNQNSTQNPTVSVEEAKTVEFPEVQPSQVKYSEDSGSQATKSLVFGILSLAIGGVTLFIGGFFNFIRSMISSMGGFPGPFSVSPYTLFPILIIVHVVCLIFAIVGTVNGGRAKEFDPDDGVGKAGHVFSILGIVLNSIAMAVAGIFLFMTIFTGFYFFSII